MKTENMDFAGQPGWLWTPDAAPRAVILALHGMTEHAGRFASFARAMTGHGIAVAAYDLPGHGTLSDDPNCSAMVPGDWGKGFTGIGLALKELRKQYAVPLYLLGFSLGSFLVRDYLDREPCEADGVILIGTGSQPRWLLRLMKGIVSAQIRKHGYETAAPLVRRLSFGTYNQKFRPTRTDYDWLCSDEGQIDTYLADPLCRRGIGSGTFYELLDSMEQTATFRQVQHPIPVLLLSGDRDAVGNFGSGVRKTAKRLTEAGYDVRLSIYPGARHMLLHEETGGQAEAAQNRILSWINAHI